MKIGGIAIARAGTEIVRIPLPDGAHIEVKIRAYPLGFDVDDIFPYPDPPKVKARRVSGQVERENGRVVWDVNERDPQYVRRRNELAQARVAANFLAAVVRGTGRGEFEFETELPESAQDLTEDQALALWEELIRSGLTDGDCNIVIRKALELSNQTQEAQERALSGFSPEDESPTDGADGAA